MRAPMCRVQERSLDMATDDRLTPVAAIEAIARIEATSSGVGALTRLASMVVVPRARWWSATAATSVGSADVNVWLPPP